MISVGSGFILTVFTPSYHIVRNDDTYNALSDCNVLAMLYHANLFDRPYLMDLDSTNGTYINVSVLVMCFNLV
jgi:pSer/pThr/pTyr-binding forkhead associated (FHA) protein